MEIQSAANVVFNVKRQPGLDFAQERVDGCQQRVDKLEISLKGDVGVKAVNYPKLFTSVWEGESPSVTQPVGLACFAVVVASAITISKIAGAIPALAPFAGVLGIATAVAGFIATPKLAGPLIVQPILRRRVNGRMNQFLELKAQDAREDLRYAKERYEEFLADTTRNMIAAAQPSPDPGTARLPTSDDLPGPQPEIHIDENEVVVGGIRIPRRVTTAG